MWREVKGFEGLYQISINGEVRSSGKLRKIRNHVQYYPPKILKQSLSNKGYKTVSLWKDGVKKNYWYT
jgi:hypothetical protein